VCNRDRPGQVYNFWGGTCVSHREAGSVLSSRRVIYKKYQNLRMCGYFVCRGCAARMRRWSAVPGVVLCGLGAVGFGVAAQMGQRGPQYLSTGLWAFAGLLGLGFLLELWQLILPSTSSARMDGIVLRRARPQLRIAGKGDEFFTEADYLKLFRSDPSYAQSAEDILAQAARRPGRKKKKPSAAKEVPTKPCKYCNGAIPEYAQACPLCKKILV
jgi:hypothetical protein